MGISEYFNEVETKEEYNGYFFSIKAAITIVVLGTFCGLKNKRHIISPYLIQNIPFLHQVRILKLLNKDIRVAK